MTQFEYVTVFLSILLALAVAELLAGLGRLIRERDHVKIYWVHVAWMILGILAVTQSWWVIWNIRAHEFANFFEFLALVIPRLIWVLFAFLLAPPISPDQPFDLRAYYYRHMPWVAPLFGVALLGIALSRLIFGVEELLSPVNAIRVLAIALIVSLRYTKNPKIHGAAVFVTAGLFALAITIVYFERTG